MKGFRKGQVQAAREILDLFESGKKVVFLDAPTGSGKTLIGEMVRRKVGGKALYVCSGKQLQDQFAKDFPYARVLKGRSNYPTLLAPFPQYSCLDCNKEGQGTEATCDWCDPVTECPYRVAKEQMLGSDLGVINVSYLLSECNYVRDSGLSGRKLVVLDEADVVESELMGFVEFRVSARTCGYLGISWPKKGARKATIGTWLEKEFVSEANAEAARLSRSREPRLIRRRQSLLTLARKAKVIAGELLGEGEETGNWVRDYDRDEEGGVTLKPIKVSDYAEDLLWRHGQQWLCMSATIVSDQEMAESLGLKEEEWGGVKLGMEFKEENRRIVVSAVANMTRKTEEKERPVLLQGIEGVLRMHENENVLVHSNSYALTRWLLENMEKKYGGRRVIGYLSAAGRDRALQEFVENGGVLIAPSLGRGIDLPDDLCRVIIVAKIPFPYLGDRQISARLKSPGGQMWYNVQTVRSLVQSTGRGVRHENDWAVSYILDAQFMRFWKGSKGLLPQWWREAVEIMPPKKVIKGVRMG